MGLFSNSKKVSSIKTHHQDTLVTPNILRLTKEVESRPQSDFVRQWMYCCVAGIDWVDDQLLFKDIKDKEGNDHFVYADGIKQNLNPFKQSIEKLNYQKVFEIFKLLGGYYLVVFIQHEDNVLHLKNNGLDKYKFEEGIFEIFHYTNDDKAIYQELKNKFEENSPGYFIALFRKIFEKAYSMPSENNLFASVGLSGILSNSYDIFMQLLNKQISKVNATSIFSR